jgi:hypothetical protein
VDSYLCMILQQLSSAITLLCSSILFTHDHYCYWEAGCHTNDIHYTELLAIEPTDLNSLQTLQARHPFILSVSQCRYMFMGDHACVTMYICIHTKTWYDLMRPHIPCLLFNITCCCNISMYSCDVSLNYEMTPSYHIIHCISNA